MKEDALTYLASAGAVAPLDVHFARLLEQLNGGRSPSLALAAALASSFTRQGHICIDLRELGGRSISGLLPGPGLLPDARTWQAELTGSKVVGAEGEYKPLILDRAGRLYIYRYWEYQDKLVRSIKARIAASSPFTEDALKEQLNRMFPASPGEVDWQKIAAFAAASKMFCVISGGPGTGKTSTVAKILVVLLDQAGAGKRRIALAAPTGKAAARLQEAITSVKERLECREALKRLIPESASTIHRLLGTIQGTPYFRYNEDNRLPFDIVVVDEASMVDLALMSKLLQATARHARLILLGDKDQLASVDAGAVLGDICNSGEQPGYSRGFVEACGRLCGCRPDESYICEAGSGRLNDCVVQLQKSYRFSESSGISLLSRAVRDRNAEAAFSVLKSNRYSDLAWSETPPANDLGSAIKSEVLEGFRPYLREVAGLRRYSREEPFERLRRVFDLFEAFRVLCPLREGPYGVAALNLLLESILDGEHLIGRSRPWYHGRPVMVRQNNYNLRLFNGDVGIFLPDIVSNGDSRVFFPCSDGTYRSFHPFRLPEHETVYAMTVHKSQGSEFDSVLLIFPDKPSPVLTRELVYTGITRARERVSIRASEQVLRHAIHQRTQRLSGLSDALWGADEG